MIVSDEYAGMTEKDRAATVNACELAIAAIKALIDNDEA